MYYQNFKKSSITPKKAVEILKSYGTEMTEGEAEIVLEFMKKMAEIAINQGIRIQEMNIKKSKYDAYRSK